MQTIQIRLTEELIKKAQGLVDKGLYSNKSEVIRDALRHLVFIDQLSTKREKEFKVLFTADLHGNESQYDKLFEKAIEDRVNAVIIGGDIAPKDIKHRTIEQQRLFLERFLMPLLRQFNKKRDFECVIYLMMGNDDFKSNYNYLKEIEKKEKLFRLIHKKFVKLHDSFSIAGYSFVPLTPFRYKDWEKLDLDKEDERKTRVDILEEGVISGADGFLKYKFKIDHRNNTIEKDLKKLIQNAERTVLVAHSPPYGTKLDQDSSGNHIGSRAVRKFIEEKHPYLTLHGHVHETTDQSGCFKQKIGRTLSIGAGNYHDREKLAVVEFNLFDIDSAKRELI